MNDSSSLASSLGGISEAPQSNATQNVAVTTAAGATAAAASTQQSYSSMQELQKRNPKLYNLMVQGCMEAFCQDQERHDAEYKKIMRENVT